MTAVAMTALRVSVVRVVGITFLEYYTVYYEAQETERYMISTQFVLTSFPFPSAKQFKVSVILVRLWGATSIVDLFLYNS